VLRKEIKKIPVLTQNRRPRLDWIPSSSGRGPILQRTRHNQSFMSRKGSKALTRQHEDLLERSGSIMQLEHLLSLPRLLFQVRI
jgi:hypothetical protein